MPEDRPIESGSRAARWTRAEAAKERWQQGSPPDALAALRADPELGADKQIVLDLAYEEYCLQEAAGRAVPVEEYAAQFPTHRQSLLRLLAVHSFLNAHPNALKLPDVKWPAPGDTLAEFAIVRPLGRGGFAHVYLARETTAGNRAVVLKVSADGLEEGNTLGPLVHPHVMRVLAARRIGDLSVLVMPFLGAATLEDVAQDRPADSDQLIAACAAAVEPGDPVVTESLPSPFTRRVQADRAVAALGLAVADALAFVHQNGLAHQDLKPSNVLLTPSGFPLLLDFNLTTRAEPSRGSVGGTVPYMAPEQLVAFCSPGTPATHDRAAADVYSLGVILYELLAGRHPFSASALSRGPSPLPSREAVEARQKPPPPLRSLNPAIDPALAAVVAGCLSPNPMQRPTARAVAVQLRAILEPRPPRRLARWLLIMALVTAAAGGLGAYFTRDAAPAPPPITPQTPFERGLFFLKQNDTALAGSEFMTAAQADNDGRAYGYAAFCMADRRLHVEAVFCADKAIGLGFREAWVYSNRAFCLSHQNRPEAARGDCDTALSLQPECVEARYIRARLALDQLQLDAKQVPGPEAIADIEFVRRRGPGAPDASLTAAYLYVGRNAPGDTASAVTAVREAIERGENPERVRTDSRLITALGGLVEFQQALKAGAGPKRAAKTPGLIRPPTE